MNRRSFLSAMLRAGVGAALLPGAVTYARKWKRETIWMPQWEDLGRGMDHVAFNPTDYRGEWSLITPTQEVKDMFQFDGPGLRYELKSLPA